MRLLLTCPGCGSTASVACIPGCNPADGHQPDCKVADLDAALNCVPGGPCCLQDHHHGQNAGACPGAGLRHAGAACSHADPKACLVVTDAGEDCPGGHCGLGVDGCTVCRPITVTVIDLGIPMGS
jgi:hypothetical protein